MRGIPIFPTSILLILLFTTCIFGIQAAEPQQPPIAKVKSDTAKVDSLAWYAGPLPVFESMAKYQEYSKRQANVIRDHAIQCSPDIVYIKDKNGETQTITDDSRMGFKEAIASKDLPKIVQDILPVAKFYILKVVDSNYEKRGSGLVCRINNENYNLPQDINFVLSVESTGNKISNEKKIELLISLIQGVGTNYQIINMAPKRIRIGHYYTNIEVLFLMDAKNYVGYLVLNNNELYSFYFKDEDSNSFRELIINHSNAGYKIE